jgi:hypothetical protein
LPSHPGRRTRRDRMRPGGSVAGRGARAKNPPVSEGSRSRADLMDSGDNRLSRQRHYHGPGGLNGRVRNGNGCCPARMVAGNVPGRRSGAAGDGFPRLVTQRLTNPINRLSGSCSTTDRSNEPQRNCTPNRSDAVWSSGHRVVGFEGAAPRSGWSSCLAVRTGRLKRSPAVHARPIDLVVFQEPTHYCWKPHLGGGFALRCLQRLSGPDLATRRCRERDSRYTRGRSSPILSY